ncbi:MAG: hypothetical protein IJ124_07530 [Clostridia bacterium]|nr:hypothetical protein [Clostridia bacterium]
MTMSGYSSAIVDVMLGWLKGLANWVLRLFNLAGSVTTSPLLWLSHNWMKLLIFFLVLGVVLDRLVWLIRWRPYWVWFKKERVIVNDDKFFASADMDKASSRESDLEGNWDEHDYVVASTVVKRRAEGKSRGAVVKDGKRPQKRTPAQPRRRSEGTKVARRVERGDGAARTDRVERASASPERTRQEAESKPVRRESSPDSIFAGNLNKSGASDVYEDEVFNVANLPAASDYKDDKRPRKSAR